MFSLDFLFSKIESSATGEALSKSIFCNDLNMTVPNKTWFVLALYKSICALKFFFFFYTFIFLQLQETKHMVW